MPSLVPRIIKSLEAILRRELVKRRLNALETYSAQLRVMRLQPRLLPQFLVMVLVQM